MVDPIQLDDDRSLSTCLSLSIQKSADLAAELGTELALEKQRHHETWRLLIATRHRIMLGHCPLCDYEAKGLGTHVRTKHPTYDTDGH